MYKRYPPTIHPSEQVQYFALLSAADYTEGDNPVLTDHCTLLRTAGRCDVDVNIATDGFGFASIIYEAALVVCSEEALQSGIAADPDLLQYSPANTMLGVRTRIVHHFFQNSFTVAMFQDTVDMVAKFLPVFTGDEQRLGIQWDVKQKVKMKSDEALWLAIVGTTAGTVGEGDDWATVISSRTLYAD